MFNRPLLIAASLALATGATFAQGTPQEDVRNQHQEASIHQGERTGKLTQPEAQRLNREELKIRRTEEHAAADGHVSKAEREHINKMQYEAARNIQRDKQNGRTTEGY